jgi:hypothetical protein
MTSDCVLAKDLVLLKKLNLQYIKHNNIGMPETQKLHQPTSHIYDKIFHSDDVGQSAFFYYDVSVTSLLSATSN